MPIPGVVDGALYCTKLLSEQWSPASRGMSQFGG